MGIARLLLALSVVFAHGATWRGLAGVGGQLAVQMFFVISGFYMALVLDQKYPATSAGRRSFWINRFLRLAPCYYAVLGATLLLSFSAAWLRSSPTAFPPSVAVWREFGSHLSWGARLVLGLSNVTIIGQDVPQFLAVNPASGELVAAFRGIPPGCVPGWQFCVIPQAWTLSLEFLFYLLAPFLVRRATRTLVLLIGLSVLTRVATYYLFGQHDPWTYRFFPSELALFVTGILTYRWHQVVARNDASVRRDTTARVVGGLALVLLLVYERLNSLVPVLAFAAAVPWLFIASRNESIDRNLGELSYPVYLAHVMFLPFALMVAGYVRVIPPGVVDAVLAIVFAAVFYRLVERPIDRLRQGRVARARLASP